MSEEKKPATEVATKNPGHRFREGHIRWGGKKKRTAQMARDLAEHLGCDPLEFLLRIIHSDTYSQTVIGADGKKQKKEVVIDLPTRIDAAKAVAGFFYPKLNSTAVTGSEGGPVESVQFRHNQAADGPGRS